MPMTKSPEELMAMPFGGASVAENLRHAVATGAVIENEDGTVRLSDAQSNVDNWIFVNKGPPLGCDFLMYFLFQQVYAKSAVPQGCGACYKVKVVPRTLRELVAAWEIGKRVECRSKWGIDFDNPYSQHIYAGYFYTSGLDAARTIFKVVREFIDKDPKLGPGIAMTIKRGCSEYEVELGPSDRYEFAPELGELESYLKAKFRSNRSADRGTVALTHWIDVAFRLGDDSYLDFTAGKRLRTETLSYDP
jgi:hypothetical protein